MSVGGCCSEGHCTDKVVCDGNKGVWDYCDSNSECLTNYCNLQETTARDKPSRINWCEKFIENSST